MLTAIQDDCGRATEVTGLLLEGMGAITSGFLERLVGAPLRYASSSEIEKRKVVGSRQDEQSEMEATGVCRQI